MAKKNPPRESVSQPTDLELKESNGHADTLIDGAAKISVQPAADGRAGDGEPAVISVHKEGRTETPLLDHLKAEAGKKKDTEVKEVDFSTHPDVLELAEAAADDVALFSNDGEVQHALDIKHAEALNSLPLYSLANRIKKFFYRSGFYAGWLACLAAGNDDKAAMHRQMMIRARRKVASAQTTLRQTKHLLALLSRVGDLANADQKQVTAAVAAQIAGDPDTELTIENFRRVVKAGDQRKHALLDKVATALTEIEGE